MQFSRIALVLVAATSVASCVSEPGFGFAQFTIDAVSNVTAPQGGATVVVVTITRAAGYTETIDFTFSNLPTGVLGDAKSTSENSVTLSLIVGLDAVPGPHTIRITGKQNNFNGADDVILTVTPVPQFSLSVASPALSIAQGASAPTQTIFIARTTYAGPVTLAAFPPPGVTASFAPVNPQTGISSVLTLTVNATANVGTSNVLVSGFGDGGSGMKETFFSLTITPGPSTGTFTLSTAPPSPVSLVQGTSTNVTVNINRTGGNTSSVALTATFAGPGTAPAGLALSFLPASTTDVSSQLTVATTSATPAGPHTYVIRGNATGLAEQTTNLTINVTAPVAGTATVSFASCTAVQKPVWLAFLDGTAGTWTAVTGVADVYTFPIAQPKASFAYVTVPFGTARIFVRHMTQAELLAGTITPCGVTVPAGRSANGVIANLPAANQVTVHFGGTSYFNNANGAFQVTNAQQGTFDLIGFALQGHTGGVATRAFIARGENPPAGGTFSVPVDFADAVRSANAAAGAGTLTGLTGTETELYSNMIYYTGGAACRPTEPLYAAVGTPPGFSFFGIPAALRLPTDMHSLQLQVVDGNSSRTLNEAFVDVAARAASPFLMPPPLPAPVVTDAGGPYKRPRAVVAPAPGLPAVYDVSHTLFYIDNGGSGEQGTVAATQGWVGGSGLTLELPNFAGVAGFQNSWAPAASDLLNWNLRSVGGAGTTTCVAGQRGVAAARVGTL